MSKEKMVATQNFTEYDALSICQLGETLKDTGKRLAKLKKKKRKINKIYFPTVKNSLDAYGAMWEEAALRDLGRPGVFDEEWRNRLGHRELYFKDIKFRSKLKKVNGKITNEALKYDHLLKLIKTRTS